MKRVMGVDPLTCKRCATPMIILAFISNLDVVRKILDHLKIPVGVVPRPLTNRPSTTQTMMDELGPEPTGDPVACPSASHARAKFKIALGQARGPPSA